MHKTQAKSKTRRKTMTMPKMYIEEEKKESKPMPLLKITEDMQILAVDYGGQPIALITNNLGYARNAKQSIKADGYDTSWAEWDDEGRFVNLKEDE